MLRPLEHIAHSSPNLDFGIRELDQVPQEGVTA